MKDKAEFYFNSSLVKAYLSESLMHSPPSPSSNDDDDAADLLGFTSPPPPSKRRIALTEAQLDCSPAIAEKVLRLADLHHRNLQTFTASVMKELDLEAHLVDIKSRDPELRTKRAKKIIKIQALQRMVFQQLESVESLLPLLQIRACSAGPCHVIFKYDCLLDLPKGGGGAWQGLTFQIAYAAPPSLSGSAPVAVWEDAGGGGIYDVSQQSTLAPRDAVKVWTVSMLVIEAEFCFNLLRVGVAE